MQISGGIEIQVRLNRYRDALLSILRSRRFSKPAREDFLTEFETAARIGDWSRAQYVLALAVEFARPWSGPKSTCNRTNIN